MMSLINVSGVYNYLSFRIIGAGQIEDFKAPGVSPLAMEDAFQAGVRLLGAYKRIHSVDQLTVIALMLA